MKKIALLVLLVSFQAEARVFSINDSSFGTYFKGSFGTSNLKSDAFADSSGASTTSFSEEADYNWGGEIGFFFPSKDYTVRLGLAIIAPTVASDNSGSNASGTKLMSIDSDVYGFFPMAHFEYYTMRNNYGRVYISFGGGFGKVSMKNSYNLTGPGDTAYTTPNEFTERASQLAYIMELGVGYEMSFVQTVTVTFDLGYRYSNANNLKYDNTGSDFLGGHADGDSVVNDDGEKRSLDLGGVFTGLSFRFYFN